eukprot:1160862-Pelagomonas_calceolata.AAC.1
MSWPEVCAAMRWVLVCAGARCARQMSHVMTARCARGCKVGACVHDGLQLNVAANARCASLSLNVMVARQALTIIFIFDGVCARVLEQGKWGQCRSRHHCKGNAVNWWSGWVRVGENVWEESGTKFWQL